MSEDLLQDFVAFDRSLWWEQHDAFFSGQAASAWLPGRVPFWATSNPAAAAQAVRLVAALARGNAPVRILEIGGGKGLFARHFLEALHQDPEYRSLAGRLSYVWADFSPQIIADALTGPLAEHAAAGRLQPALWNARTPDILLTPDGQPLPVAANDTAKFTVVIANYVVCALLTRGFRYRDGWQEAHVRTFRSEPVASPSAGAISDPPDLADMAFEFAWKPLQDVLPPAEAAVLECLKGDRPIAWPSGFFAALDGLAPLMAEGAAALVMDFGSVETDSIPTDSFLQPQVYGNSVGFPVQFPVLAAWACARQRAVLHTLNPLRAIHVAAISFGPTLPERFVAALESLDRHSPSQDLLDFSAAARLHAKAGEHAYASRFLERCVQLAPHHAPYRLEAANAAIEAACPQLALAHLDVYRSQHPEDPDALFAQARALHLKGDYPAAETLYQRHLALNDSSPTRVNLGLMAEIRDDLVQALAHYQRALQLNGDFEQARQRIEFIRNLSWQRLATQAMQLLEAPAQLPNEIQTHVEIEAG